MKRLIPCLCALSLSVALLPASAATRLASFHLESYGALQRQLFMAAEVFEAPELGAVPMLVGMSVPGFAHVDQTKPVALHLYDLGRQQPAVLAEVTPAAGQGEALLRAIAGMQDQELSPAVNGIYALANGAARMMDEKILLAGSVQDLDAILGENFVAPAMPEINGVLRMSVMPSAMRALPRKWKAELAAMGDASDPAAMEGLDEMMSLYERALAQLAMVEFGIAVDSKGLWVHSRATPEPGTAAAELVRTMTPVPASQRAFFNADSLLCVASGGFVLPENVSRRLLDLYQTLFRMSPMLDAEDAEAMTAMLEESLAILGAPAAVAAHLDPEGPKLMMQGLISVENAAAVLASQLEMIRSEAHKHIMAKSGFVVEGVHEREVQDETVYSFAYRLDENPAALREAIKAQMPEQADPEAVEAGIESGIKTIQTMMGILGSGYDYAAVPEGIVFGLGNPEMVGQALTRAKTEQGSPEADRIVALLEPAAAPYALIRFALLDAVRMALQRTELPLPPAIREAVGQLPAGEGIMAAAWIEDGRSERAMLIPATDIKALSQMLRSMQQGQGM